MFRAVQSRSEDAGASQKGDLFRSFNILRWMRKSSETWKLVVEKKTTWEQNKVTHLIIRKWWHRGNYRMQIEIILEYCSFLFFYFSWFSNSLHHDSSVEAWSNIIHSGFFLMLIQYSCAWSLCTLCVCVCFTDTNVSLINFNWLILLSNGFCYIIIQSVPIIFYTSNTYFYTCRRVKNFFSRKKKLCKTNNKDSKLNTSALFFFFFYFYRKHQSNRVGKS